MLSIAALDPALVAGATLLLALLAGEGAGRLAARLEARADDRVRSQIGALQGAVLGLVGLVLAFSFSMAVARFETRRALVLEEANAIGTTWLRTDALPEPARSEVRALLRTYVANRVAFYDVGEHPAGIEAEIQAGEALQSRIWAIVEGASVATPGSLPLALLVTSLNDAIDLSASRVIAHDARVPDAIIGLQMCLAVVGVGTMGFGFGLARAPHRLATVLLALLLAGILSMILDLDQSRRGRIRVSQEAMLRLQRSMDGP